MKYTSLLSLLFLFFLSACHTTNYFMMPVYKPAEQIFPATGSTVLVVNNAVEQSPMVGTTFVFSDGSAEKLAIRRDRSEERRVGKEC